MALSKDIHTIRYGTPDGHQLVSQPMLANTTVYGGSIALTSSAGYIKNAASPLTTDTCWGIIVPNSANVGNGWLSGTNNGDTVVNIETGSFFLAVGTGSDALTQADVGATVYVIDEQTVGKVSTSRPIAGTFMAIDPAVPGKVAVRMGSKPEGTGSP